MNKLKIFRPKNFQQTHCSNPYAPHPRYTSPGIVVNVAIGFDRPERRTSEISCFLCLESFNEVHNESFSDVKTFSMPSSIHHRNTNGKSSKHGQRSLSMARYPCESDLERTLHERIKASTATLTIASRPKTTARRRASL